MQHEAQPAPTRFPIGGTYPYRERRDGMSKALPRAVNAVTDPAAILNPGVPGFPDGDGRA